MNKRAGKPLAVLLATINVRGDSPGAPRTDGDPGVPRTGDDANMTLWIMTGSGALGVLCYVLIWRRYRPGKGAR
jgi:hypothetical protein